MKRRELIKKLEENGCYLLRHGHDHDIYTNGKNTEPVPRHSDINEELAKKILRKLGL